MSAIDAAIAHWKSLPRKSIDVPEWGAGDKPLVIFWKPWTLEERMKVFGAGELTLDAYVAVILLKAENEQGEKMFTLEDKPKLRRFVEPSVLARVALEIMKAPTPEDVEKN